MKDVSFTNYLPRSKNFLYKILDYETLKKNYLNLDTENFYTEGK